MSFSAHARTTSWNISRQWNETEENLYSEFVYKIGKAIRSGQCRTADDCLRSYVANPMFASKNPYGLKKIFSDCADLPYILRAYFAFMRELPFVLPKQVKRYSPEIDAKREEVRWLKVEFDSYSFWKRPWSVRRAYRTARKELKALVKKAGKDIRYTRTGNQIVKLTKIKNGDSINEVLKLVNYNVSTAVFRVNAGLFDQGDVFKDTYPVKIQKESIRPGTILYDPAGHIAVVADVTRTGKVYLIDAHPDNSISYISYGEKFSRSSVKIGAGFLKFRPYRHSYGRYYPTANKNLPDFSLEQYYGSDLNRYLSSWRRAKFNVNGQNLPFVKYVRTKLAASNYVVDPVQETRSMFQDLCRDFKERVIAVNDALKAGMDKKDHPKKLPDNIYGTEGEWETYSTPSRDARLKASVKELYETIQGFLGVGGQTTYLRMNYRGSNLKVDLFRVYLEESRRCTFYPKNSLGYSRGMTMDEGLKKLFDFSFDPYMCAELRWGYAGDDLRTCDQSRNKWKWHRALRPLRNQIQRNYSAFMGYKRRQLDDSGLGVEETPNFDIDQLLRY